jgi:hypothetical protein
MTLDFQLKKLLGKKSIIFSECLSLAVNPNHYLCGFVVEHAQAVKRA